jgi:hypothetical protein
MPISLAAYLLSLPVVIYAMQRTGIINNRLVAAPVAYFYMPAFRAEEQELIPMLREIYFEERLWLSETFSGL